VTKELGPSVGAVIDNAAMEISSTLNRPAELVSNLLCHTILVLHGTAFIGSYKMTVFQDVLKALFCQ
jgi:hypothetical protein